ncbi:MAG: rane protein [Actinomycetota bacterium]|jgi:membrane protein|nr:rane protein [Actinomycetota bacterium]
MATALRVQKRFSEVHGGWLASAVTLTAFLSLFPLILVVIAVIGFFSAHGTDVGGNIIRGLGLPAGDATKSVFSAIDTAQKSRRAASIIGIAGLLWSGLGVVAALEYAIDTVWQVPSRGIKDKLSGLAWLVGAGVILGASFALTAVINFLPGFLAPVAIAVGLAVDVVLWLWTLKVLGNHEVGWRPLLPGAVLGAIGFEILKAVGSIYVPRAVASSSALYGSIGVVFAVLAWLLFFGRLVVYAAVLNVVRWEEDHGTVTVEIELPNLPDQVPVAATRAGEAEPTPAVRASA